MGDWTDKAVDLPQDVKACHAMIVSLRVVNNRLNRRAQLAEAGMRENVEACRRQGVSLGRVLANAAAGDALRRLEAAEARIRTLQDTITAFEDEAAEQM